MQTTAAAAILADAIVNHLHILYYYYVLHSVEQWLKVVL